MRWPSILTIVLVGLNPAELYAACTVVQEPLPPQAFESGCPGPTDGTVSGSLYDFSYESWVRRGPQTGEFFFADCIQNFTENVSIRVSWGSMNIYVPSNDISKNLYRERVSVGAALAEELSYGARPFRIDTEIMRPVTMTADQEYNSSQLCNLVQSVDLDGSDSTTEGMTESPAKPSEQELGQKMPENGDVRVTEAPVIQSSHRFGVKIKHVLNEREAIIPIDRDISGRWDCVHTLWT
jgi:hypothetical protein